MKIQLSIDSNMSTIINRFGSSSDLLVKAFHLTGKWNKKIVLMYLDTITDQDKIERMLDSVMTAHKLLGGQHDEVEASDMLDYIKRYLLPVGEVDQTDEMVKLEEALLAGKTVFMAEDCEYAVIAIHTHGLQQRGVEEPSTQTVIRGPRDGFTETLKVNIGLVRKRIKDPNLRIETSQLGSKTRTDVAVLFLEGAVQTDVLDKVRSRLSSIVTDSILESGYIEEFIKERTFSPFPTLFNTERPDAVAAGILEGRVAIMMDGTPFVLIAPALFVQFFQAAEDYYHPALFSLLRTLRFVAAACALLVPSLYIAVTTYQQDMIPTPLLISIMGQKEGVPFPAFVEAFMMEVTFEVLREAGIRMPKMIGQAISIVGALVLGEAAVQAGLISAAMVIVVAFTAITNLMIPSNSMAMSVRLLRFGFMFMAATFGLYGIFFGMNLLLIHLCHLSSFGIPYMYPLTPYDAKRQKDTLIRLPFSKKYSPSQLLGQFRHKDEQNE